MKKGLFTYISLFSSAGVGCFGFKEEGFQCLATNELLEKRLNIQKYNSKCKYETGYIEGDIKEIEIKNLILDEVKFWKVVHGIENVDVIIATPPCQGMSIANHKKQNDEKDRNSLVIESIKLIKDLQPNFFVFENVRFFLSSLCTDLDGCTKPIKEAIFKNLSKLYNIAFKIINFKDFGNPSSRTRTVVIGAQKSFKNINPIDLFPDVIPEKNLREVIGHLPPLTRMGEINASDIFHSFREYDLRMLPWIEPLKEGQSAFENEEPNKIPHRVINNEIVINKNKNGDKYKRQVWDKVGPCVHTRNDILSSQNTIHPQDNRVFSIRELMLMMSIPNRFKWAEADEFVLNSLPLKKKKEFLKKHEILIRTSIGEAVPTIIFQQIANRIKTYLNSFHRTNIPMNIDMNINKESRLG